MGNCVHHIPGRARFKLPQLKHDAALLGHIEVHLVSIKGIKNIQANAKAGSLVIHYDVNQTSLKDIEENLMEGGFLYHPQTDIDKKNKIVRKELPPLVGQVSGAFGRAVVHALLERAITKGVSSILAR
ncbi:MAG: hypothetical protein HWE30_07310 [Methylocystaceae bacterium]|nr:hypothetical protein [Methylocystaceae bacterium]